VSRPVLLAAFPVALVALVAGTVSYFHIEHLALVEHQPHALAEMFPFAVDGLIAAGSVVVLAGCRLGWLAMVPGIAATLFANVESGIGYGWLAAVVAGWPAIAFSLSSFVLERWLRSQVAVRSTTPVIVTEASPAEPAHTHAPAVVNGHVPVTAWAQPASTGGWS